MLLEAWRAGDASAGDALLSRHARPLLRFLRSKVGAEADDLQQRTLLACVESHQRIRGEASFRTYLYMIARHEVYRFFRRRYAVRRFAPIDASALVDPAPSAVEALVHGETQAALATALGQLDADDRALLRKFYVEGWSSPALAATLGIKPTSVRARLRRVRVELEQVLGAAGAPE